jgi:uncharacterized protein (TIGR01777 family)
VQIVIAGGSGFLGRALVRRLEHDGHRVRVLTRRPTSDRDVAWMPTADGEHAQPGPWAQALDGVDAVVNLAGEGIADRRWSEQRKRALRASRLLPTRSLVTAIRSVARPPAAFISGSAVGYYGPHGNELVTESTPPGADVLGRLSVEWEQEAERASATTRVVRVRTGLVLHPDGGVLSKMLLPFRLGAGGQFGSGTQYMPWIHLDDWVALVLWLMTHRDADEAFNASAPTPVTNAEFTRALGRTLRRPTFMRVPAAALRLLLGELAESLLTGQRAIPARAEGMGFQFRFSEIEPALRGLIH